MIALPSIAFRAFSGSAKGVTARCVGGRSILSVKCYQPRFATVAQIARRASISKITKSFKLLSDVQIKEWQKLADSAAGQPVFGQKAKLSAINVYVRLNVNRTMAGEALLLDAPGPVADIPEVECSAIWITPSRVLLSGIENPTGTYKLVVKMSSGQGNGVSSGWSKTVIITPGMDDDWGDARLTQLYNSKIGFMPSVGEKIFLEYYWLDPETGFVGETMRDKVICTSEEQAKEEGFEKRVQFAEDEFTSLRASVSSLDVELLGGIPFIAIECSYAILSYVMSVDLYLTENQEQFFSAYSMVFGRSTLESGLLPSIFSIYCSKEYRNDGNRQVMDMSHRAGNYQKQGEIFGSNLLMGYRLW